MAIAALGDLFIQRSNDCGLGAREHFDQGELVYAQRVRYLQRRAKIKAEDQPRAGHAQLAGHPFQQIPNGLAFDRLEAVYLVGAVGTGLVALAAVSSAPAEMPFRKGADPFPSVTRISAGPQNLALNAS